MAGKRIVCTPGTCSGDPRIAGTRIRAERVASAFKGGWSFDECAMQFGVSGEDAEAAVRFFLRDRRYGRDYAMAREAMKDAV